MKKTFRIIGKIIDSLIILPFGIAFGLIVGPVYACLIIIDSLWDIPSIDD